MKRVTYIFLFLAFLVVAKSSYAEVPQWQFDKNHSNFYFSVLHIFSTIQGRFEEYSGDVRFDPENLDESTFLFEIKVDSISTHIAKRDKHLLSSDFFDETKYPLMRFASTTITKTGENTFDVAGTFTVKGNEYPLTLPMTLTGITDHPTAKNSLVAGFDGKVTIDRLAYGVGTGKFVDLGIVGRDVDIFVSLELLRDK